MKKALLTIGTIALIAVLCTSIGFNIYFVFFYMKQDTYLQSIEEIYVMEAGILRNNLEFQEERTTNCNTIFRTKIMKY